MKRIQSACICQTLHFQLKEELGHASAVRQVHEEVAQYKRTLERNHTRCRIVGETPQDDGSIVLQVIKQYNGAPVGSYLD